VIRRVIDVQTDPQGKNALLSGQINQFQCQNCGMVNSVSSPLLYHDASNELLIAFVPMDVAMKQNTNEEQMVGQLMNELTASIPKEEFRSYMFNPKRALTLKGLMEQVLEADGVTPEMIAEQEKRVELVQKFFETESEEALIALITEHDDDIDMSVFQTLSLMAQRLMQSGQQQAVGHLAAVQQVLVERSTFGQELQRREEAQQATIEAVSADLDQFDENTTRTDFLDLAISYGNDEEKLQALVGMVRPAFDYEFFMEFSQRIEQAPADERETLEGTRDMLRELTEMIDQQSQMMMQQKTQFLQALINTDDYEQIMQANLDAIDDGFMQVVTANIQEAERRQDIEVGARLRQIYETAVRLLQSQMSPELRFINQLLSTEEAADRQALIESDAPQFDSSLLEVVDAVENILAQRGQADAIERLTDIRQALSKALS